MKYITHEDLYDIIQSRLLDESIVGFPEEMLDRLEEKAIAFAVSYISGRYKTNLIFAEPPLRNYLLVQAIAMIVVYRAVRRNAARKVPSDYVDLYNEAQKILTNIQNGSQLLDGLPEVTGENGSTASLMYGNNLNKDFFI